MCVKGSLLIRRRRRRRSEPQSSINRTRLFFSKNTHFIIHTLLKYN